MAKRFTDTEIWEQDWFIELPNKYKMFWFYVKDRCDNAGFWRPNKANFQKMIGEPINMDDFLSFVNGDKERIKVLPTGRWFIKEYFIFQYGDKFSPTSQVHKGALKTLVQNGVHPAEILSGSIGNLESLNIQQLKEVAYAKDIDNLNIAFGNPSLRVKDKDKDKDKKKGGMEENKKPQLAIKIDLEQMIAIFDDGTFQPLGPEQERSVKSGSFQPHYIRQGIIQ
jgi:hypothetical protein